MSHKTLDLDLAKTPILKPIIYGRVGDEDMQTVTVNITSRDTPVDLTDFTITFEGITNGGQTKVFDVGGIKATDLKKGSFTYTFPNMAFAVEGNYEIAYFSIVKGKQRDTTGEFDIIVRNNADIDAEEAETIITEYNKLVQELHEITDQYISDSDAKFADLNKKIADLQTKITQYQTTVQNTADTAVSTINTTKDNAVSTVNSTASSAVKTINDALEEFKAADFYNKSQSDTRFASAQSLTDLENKAFANKGNIASGTDLDSVTDTGFYRIGGLVGGTDILNVPSETNGIRFYAFLTVTGSLQELTVYSPKQDTTWTYSRSISGSPAIWSNWSKTVMADDSGKVTINNLVASSITRPNDTKGWVDLVAGTSKYKVEGSTVTLSWNIVNGSSVRDIPLGTLPANLAPSVALYAPALAARAVSSEDRHLEIGSNMIVKILSASAGQTYNGQFKYDI